MKEKGIDLSGRQPKGLNDLPPVEMDYLVTMGCEETCPAVLAKKMIEWKIPDPKGKSIEVFREVRDLIEDKVRSLLQEVDRDWRAMTIRKRMDSWPFVPFCCYSSFSPHLQPSPNRSFPSVSVPNIIPASCINSISPLWTI